MPLKILASYAVMLASVQALAIAASLMHAPLGQPLAIAILACSITAGWLYGRNVLRPRRERAPLGAPFVRVLALATCSVAAAVFVLSWVAVLCKPDFSWDGNTYHVPTIHFWARLGYIDWIAFDYDPGPQWGWWVDWCFNTYPKGAETISFVLVQAFGTRFAHANNLVFLPLGVAGISVAASSLGASRWSAILVGACFALIPVAVGQGLTAYVDASLASAIAGLVGCLAVVLPPLWKRKAPFDLAPALGAALGLTISIKASGLAPAGLCIALLVGVAARARRHGAFMTAIGLMMLLVGGYWYARNWTHTGNPIAPVRVSLLGHEIFPGIPLKQAVSENVLTPDYMLPWPAWKRVAYTWIQGFGFGKWPRSISWYDAREGGLGFLWLLGCIPSVLYVGVSSHRGRRVRLLVLACIVIVVLVSFLVTPVTWWSRYTIWLHAAGLPCLAVAVDRFASRARLRPVIVALVAIAIGEGTVAFASQGFSRGAPGPLHADDFVRGLTRFDGPNHLFPLSALDREAVSSAAPVAIGPLEVPNYPLLGQLSQPVGARDVVFLSKDVGNDAERLRDLCTKHDIRWIFWPDDELAPEPVRRLSLRRDRTARSWRVFDVESCSDDLRARNRWGETPLHTLSRTDPEHAAAAFELFRARGASLEDLDARGWSALHAAARWNNTTIVRKYAELGEPLSNESHSGETPFDVAIAHRSDFAAQMLFDFGGRAHLYAHTAPPIHAAARDDDVATLESLLERGAKSDSTFRGLTPLEMAKRSGASAAVRLLEAPP